MRGHAIRVVDPCVWLGKRQGVGGSILGCGPISHLGVGAGEQGGDAAVAERLTAPSPRAFEKQRNGLVRSGGPERGQAGQSDCLGEDDGLAGSGLVGNLQGCDPSDFSVAAGDQLAVGAVKSHCCLDNGQQVGW